MSVDPVQVTATPSGETPPPAVTTAVAAPTPAAPATATGSDGEPFDAARAQRTIEALRTEIRELKPKAQAGTAAQQRLQEIEDAQKSDLEKAEAKATALQAQLDSAQAAHRDALIRAAIEREAHAQNAVDAEAVYALIDRSAIELTDAGVQGADKAVKKLLEAKPYLAKPAGATTHVPPTPRGSEQVSDADADAERVRQAQGAWLRSRI